MVAKKKSTGGGLTRSQVVTVRLDPRLKFAAELAARKQRRTISSFIEWTLERTLKELNLDDGDMNHDPTSILDAASIAWDVYEADRLVKLALFYRDLLSFEEEQIWKIISESDYFWWGGSSIRSQVPGHKNITDYFHFKNLREKWTEVVQIAKGDVDIEIIKDLEAPTLPSHLALYDRHTEVPY